MFPYVIIALACFVLLIQFGALFLPPRPKPLAATESQAMMPRPTRTKTLVPTERPTKTPLPPTATPSLTLTPVPPSPTNTPAPPTATPVPPTETPVPTDTPTETPVPPTATPVPPTAVPKPPTPVPPPVEVLSSVPVDNGELGKNAIYVNDASEVYVSGNDGHRYRAEIGFLSTPESLAKIQEFWGYGGRGGGNWKMIVLLRESVSWIACTSEDNVCWETSVNSGQASFMSKVYLKSHVWTSLLNDYLAGGWQATTRNGHYHDVQASIFMPICNAVPDIPCVGFRFTRVD